MSKQCALCGTEVAAGIGTFRMKECKHWVHSKCMDQKTPNFKVCKPGCTGEVASVEEQNSYNGHDYVNSPKAPSMMTTLSQLAKGSDGYRLLQQQCPVKSLIHDKGYGLQRLLSEGIDIEDFLNNGYHWKDLQEFRDIRERPHDTLHALGLNAEHLRDYSHLLPIKEMGITPRQVVELYGFYFPDNGAEAEVTGGKNAKRWTAEDLVGLGMTKVDLFGAHMSFWEHYETLTPSDETDRAMGILPKDPHIVELPSMYPDPIPDPVPEPPPKEEPQQPVVAVEKPKVIYAKYPTRKAAFGLRKKPV